MGLWSALRFQSTLSVRRATRLMLMAWLRLEEEMHEKPCEECEEQNRHDACGQIVLRRGDGVVYAVDAGDCEQHG